MSFLKGHIKKLKSDSFGKRAWRKRGDHIKEEEKELEEEREATERKRKAKERQKLRELSYQWEASKESSKIMLNKFRN